MTPPRFSRRPAYVSLSRVVTCQSEWAAIACRTKFDPINPAPPVTTTLTILGRPVVRQRAVWFEPILVGLVVLARFDRHVHHERWFRADALPAVVEKIGELYQCWIVRAHEKFIHLSLRRRCPMSRIPASAKASMA